MSTRDLLLRTGLVSTELLAGVAPGPTSIVERLVALGVASEDALAASFSAAMRVELVSADRLARVGREVLSLVPADLVIEHRILPVEADAETLTLAMADPDGEAAAEEMGFFAGRFVVRAIARASELRSAIERHYGVRLVARAETGKVQAIDARMAK